MKKKDLIKAILFLGMMNFIFIWLNWLIKPVWPEWNNYNTTYGFYNEPEDTIETIFLGASTIVNGFTPMELYENYGICAYNLGTEQQPVLASYYWLEEAYRLHKETLHTIVLDCSMLRRQPDRAFYQKAIDGMRFSSIKYHAVKDYTKDFNEMLSYLIPIFTYHDRWSSLVQLDFKKLKNHTNNYVRGYNFTMGRYFDLNDYNELAMLSYGMDKEEEATELNKESLYYLKKIIDFCNERNMKLILMKTPVGWSVSDHNAVVRIAEEYGLDFFDFNCEPFIDEIEFHYVLDNGDAGHMNYYGASKLTAWFGEYLSEQCNATDVRGNPNYAYMEKQLQQYYVNVASPAKFNMLEDPCDFLLAAMENRDYMVFITVKDEASGALTDKQRERFFSFGLEKLSNLGYRDSYLAVIENGTVVYELSQSKDKEINNLEPSEEILNEEETEPLPILYQGQLRDGSFYALTSGGAELGDIASCVIDGKEYAKNIRGLNIVVYDIQSHKLVDSVNFDTCVSSIRDGVNIGVLLERAEAEGKYFSELSESLQKLYLYNYRCEKLYHVALLKQLIREDGLWDYLSAYWNTENCVIFLSVLDDAAGALDETARSMFEQSGLHELATLGYRDSYLAIINSGQVLYEKKDHGELPIEIKGVGYQMISGGIESGNVSSINISNMEYSLSGRGINVVIYDMRLDEVIDRASFDTCAIPVHIAAE